MRRLFTLFSVVLAFAGVGVAGAAAATIQLVAPWGNAVYTNTDTITLTYSISAGSRVPPQAVAAVETAISAWQTFFASNDGRGHFVVTEAA
jgi:hypothetical protein